MSLPGFRALEAGLDVSLLARGPSGALAEPARQHCGRPRMRRRQQPAHRTAHRHAGGEAVLAVARRGATVPTRPPLSPTALTSHSPSPNYGRRRTVGRPWDHDYRARRVLGARPGDRPDTQQFGQAAMTAATTTSATASAAASRTTSAG